MGHIHKDDLPRLQLDDECKEQTEEKIKNLQEIIGPYFRSFAMAWRTLQGYEVMHMIRKGQVQEVDKGDSLSQAVFIARLFSLAA
jgi:transposase, IS6 family